MEKLRILKHVHKKFYSSSECYWPNCGRPSVECSHLKKICRPLFVPEDIFFLFAFWQLTDRLSWYHFSIHSLTAHPGRTLQFCHQKFTCWSEQQTDDKGPRIKLTFFFRNFSISSTCKIRELCDYLGWL